MDDDEIEGDGIKYRRATDIRVHELADALCHLELFGSNPNLRMQAVNISIVDQFTMDLEYGLLDKYHQEESTPMPEAAFLSAQSQMWIFAAYELLRTWRQRARELVRSAEAGGLPQKLNQAEVRVGPTHFGREILAGQIKSLIGNPNLVGKIKDDLRLIHIPFRRMEGIRVAIAKHELAGREKAIARMPTYGRINQSCGAIDFELENESYSMGYISRRDIADELRALRSAKPPTEQTIKEFDAFMRGARTKP